MNNTQTKAEKVQAAQDQVNLITAEITEANSNKDLNDKRFDQSIHVLTTFLSQANATLAAASALTA